MLLLPFVLVSSITQMETRIARRVSLIWVVAIVAGVYSAVAVVAQERPPSGASFWSGSDVFAAGPLLFDRPNGYQIHAIRRDKAGDVEQHAQETELIFVLDGSATLVTGGSIVDARSAGTNETTGTGIRNGESRRLGRGDIVIVPNATSHWFSEVSPAVRYFSVRLRQEKAAGPLPASVMHWTAAEAFAKGGVLFDGKEGRFFRIYALRRNKPLGVELHAVDTDLVFILDGTGTFVTGGSVREPRALGTNESTGSGIDGGTANRIGPGAVLVMPGQTPHWLRDVEGTMDFFAVKVR
jgi:mannose-6-phosphate isomerase-like protein (cupin superfamily)